MQGRIAGLFMTLFMVLPLAAIPLMSIFGVPQLGSLASTLENTGFLLEESADHSGQGPEFWNLDSAPAFGNAAENFEQASLDSSGSSYDQAFQTAQQEFAPQKNTNSQAASASWEQSLQQLARFGIRQYRLQPGLQPNSFHFSCFLNNQSATPTTTIIRFEAEAADPQSALEQVLDQAEEWFHLNRTQVDGSLL